MNKIQQHFKHLRKQEQLTLAGCILLLAAYLVYFLLWSPLAENRQRLENQYLQSRQTLQNVGMLAQEYRVLANNGAAKTPKEKTNLSILADRSAAQHKLIIKRYQPSATGGAQVRFENVAFVNVIAWLYEMEALHRVTLQDLSITSGNDSGMVNVSVRLSRN